MRTICHAFALIAEERLDMFRLLMEIFRERVMLMHDIGIMLIRDIRLFFENHMTKPENETTIMEWALIVFICVMFAFLASFGGVS